MNKYYTLLELSPGATKDEIRKAYRRLSKKYHPDMNYGSKESEEKFKEVNEAYEVLYNEPADDCHYSDLADKYKQQYYKSPRPRAAYKRQSSTDFEMIRPFIVILVAAVRLAMSFNSCSSGSYTAPRVTYYSAMPDIKNVQHVPEAGNDTVHHYATHKSKRVK